jgi:hypothetical protein
VRDCIRGQDGGCSKRFSFAGQAYSRGRRYKWYEGNVKANMSFYPLSLAEKESEAVIGTNRRLSAVWHYVRDCTRGQDGGCGKRFSPVAIPYQQAVGCLALCQRIREEAVNERGLLGLRLRQG